MPPDPDRHTAAALRHIRNALPKAGAPRALVAVSLVNSSGTGFLLAGATIFYARVVGLSPLQIGFGLAVANAASFLATVPIGRFSDRLGARTTLAGLHAWRAGWCAILAFISGPAAFIVVLTCLSVANSAAFPVTRAVVSASIDAPDRTKTLAVMRSVQNVGFSAGALLSAPLIALHTTAGSRAVVLADAASFAVAAWILLRVRLRSRPSTTPAPAVFSIPRALRDGRFVALAALDGIMSLHITILGVAVPLWILRQTAAPTALVSILVFANTLMAAALQVRFARRADSLDGGRFSLRRAGVALSCSSLLLAGSWHARPVLSTVLLVAAVAALTVGELSQQAASWTLSLHLSPEHTVAEHLAVFSLGATAQEILGPPVITVAVLAHGRIGWTALALAFLATAAAVSPLVASLDRRAHSHDPALHK